MKNFNNPFEEHLYNRYLESRNIQILKSSRIKLAIAVLVLLVFSFTDYFVEHNFVALYSRLLPLSLILTFYVCDFIFFKKGEYSQVLHLYNWFHISLLVMIYIVYFSKIFILNDFGNSSVEGVILVIAIVGIEIRGNLSTLMTILVIPFILYTLILVLYINILPSSILVQYAHVLSITVIMIVISHLKEQQNFSEYKANIKLEIEKNKSQALYNNILEQKEEIEAQKEEITIQRDLAQEQKLILEIQKKEITDSLEYAQKIQQSLLPVDEVFDNVFSEHFILYKPKNIVSGDFYWASQVNDWFVFAVADCTGHGVPAGFMSMLGFSYLKEIISKSSKTRVNEVLDILRSNIIEVLDQTNAFGSAKDGMDIGLCAYNIQSSTMYFAGANFDLIVMRNSNEAPVIEEVKGDKMPISIYYKINPFNIHEITLHKNDTIYLYSDGYHDQFGGAKGKKIKSKVFKNILQSIVSNPLISQKRLLEEYLNGWMNYSSNGVTKKYEQNDDITVLGIRI